MGEGALSIPHCGSNSLSQELRGSSLAFFFNPQVPMNCDGESNVGTVTSFERSNFKSLFDWPLLAAVPLAIPQKREVLVRKEETGIEEFPFLLFLSL